MKKEHQVGDYPIEQQFIPQDQAIRKTARLEFDELYQKIMSGSQAYRALQLLLLRWFKKTGDSHYLFLHDSLDGYILYVDWALALDEMFEESEGPEGQYRQPTPYNLPGDIPTPCDCCEKCKYKKI